MELKEKANSALGWIFGGLAIFMALPMLSVSFMSGLSYLIIATLLLPPAREYAYSKTNITLSGKVKAIAIIGLFFLSMYFLVTSSDKAAEESAIIEAQEQSANLAAIKQKNADYFNQNSVSILDEVKKLIDEKKYADALSASSKYLSSKNVELKKLHDMAFELDKKEKTEQVLAEVAKTPESDLTKLAELYAQLATINPQDAEYKEKHQAILNRVESNKAKEIAAQEEARLEKESNALSSALAKMRKSEDKIENITWYHDKTSPTYNNSNNIYLYIGHQIGSTWLRARFQYTSDDWLFIESITVVADGRKFERTGLFERDNDSRIWEWLDSSVSHDDLEMMKAIASSKDATVRYIGRQYRNDRTITAKEKAAIKNVLVAYAALGGKEP